MQHVISTQKINLVRHDSYTTGNSAFVRLIKKFIAWCEAQESNRFLWLGIALLSGIGAVLPVTLSAIVFIGGNYMALWILACVVNVPVLVVNLADQPTKLTLPVLFFAWAVDAIIIAYCLSHLFGR